MGPDRARSCDDASSVLQLLLFEGFIPLLIFIRVMIMSEISGDSGPAAGIH